MAGAYQKIEAHEDLCAERYKTIHEAIADLKETIAGSKKTIDKIVWLAVTTLIGMAGWLASQLWDGVHEPTSRPQAVYASSEH